MWLLAAIRVELDFSLVTECLQFLEGPMQHLLRYRSGFRNQPGLEVASIQTSSRLETYNSTTDLNRRHTNPFFALSQYHHPEP